MFLFSILNNTFVWPLLSETYETGIPLPWKQWADGSAPTARVSLCCAPACELTYLWVQSAQLFSSKQTQEIFFWRCLLVLSFLQNNKISSITDQTFCKGNSSYYIRPNMDQVRLDGNPIRLWDYPNSFICLHSLPVGWFWNDHSKFYIGVNKGIGHHSRIEWGLYDIKAEDESQRQHLK